MAGKIAIVGAGPSGCYVAQALLKASPDLEVDIIDALPVPYGLVRYGVAADHQGTKAVTRQFARIFERQGARFLGNITVGRDVGLPELRAAYDAVVLAAGLSKDRSLSIPGADLPGVYGSGSVTRALNEHPDAGQLPDLGSHPLILGNGNVALDLLRLLCKTPEELEGSDLGPIPSAWLATNTIETITVVGRSEAARAKFDAVMVRELGKLINVSIKVVDAGASEEPDGLKLIEALADIDGHVGSNDPKGRVVKVILRFGLQPIAVEGKDSVTGLRVSRRNGDEEVISASSILTAIGFASSGDLGRHDLVDDARRAEQGKLEEGLYSAGWFGRGPRGSIPDSRTEAQALAALMLTDLVPDPSRIGPALFESIPNVVDYSGWQRIEAHEQMHRRPDRCRQKLRSTAELLRVATHQDSIA